ncbi:unnamed protein product [Amoebophrya sp. A120]|nr:unnamed protein product [Amoebophrya sp. A120]|eukprot:GSA120T00010191001.1
MEKLRSRMPELGPEDLKKERRAAPAPSSPLPTYPLRVCRRRTAALAGRMARRRTLLRPGHRPDNAATLCSRAPWRAITRAGASIGPRGPMQVQTLPAALCSPAGAAVCRLPSGMVCALLVGFPAVAACSSCPPESRAGVAAPSGHSPLSRFCLVSAWFHTLWGAASAKNLTGRVGGCRCVLNVYGHILPSLPLSKGPEMIYLRKLYLVLSGRNDSNHTQQDSCLIALYCSCFCRRSFVFFILCVAYIFI